MAAAKAGAGERMGTSDALAAASLSGNGAQGEPATGFSFHPVETPAQPQPFDPARIEHLRASAYGARIPLVAPYDDTTGAFLALLNSAQKSILISIYGYTLDEATTILIAKHRAGVDVRILFDHTQACGTAEKAQVAKIAAAGIRHWIGTSPDAHQILHSKITVVDGQLVESGSWNYSVSAAKQANTFDLANAPDIAAQYSAFIEGLIAWVQANEPQYNQQEPSMATSTKSKTAPAAKAKAAEPKPVSSYTPPVHHCSETLRKKREPRCTCELPGGHGCPSYYPDGRLRHSCPDE